MVSFVVNFLPAAFLLLLQGHSPALGGHVLVFPAEYSHWLNMRTIMEELVARNHTVTVLVADQSPSVDYNSSKDAAKFNFMVFKVPYTRAQMHGLTEELIHFSLYESRDMSRLQLLWRWRSWLQRGLELSLQQCDAILRNGQLMDALRAASFDAALFDPLTMCADLVADVLGLPTVVSLRSNAGGVLERSCGQAPAPPSFVPPPPLPYSDRMVFAERLVSAATYVAASVMTEMIWRFYLHSYYSEVKGSPSTVCDTFGKADIWLIRSFWDMESPRPLSPNFKYVGGLHCKPAKQLPEELEAWVQSAGDAGVVVVSFGSMVANITMDRANVMATAFGQLPQKVIWRYKGQPPKKLSVNTRIFDWIPQNDLLGHPRTRALVTHGGANGLYEAVYHGVPLVGIPLFSDQPDNVARLSRRGAAITLDFHQMTSEDLAEALKAVIRQPGYKASMQRLSTIHRDQPMAPLSAAVFWVEFVMRHGGAQHLLLSSRHLTWWQYHSLDVVAALLVAVATAVALCWWCGRCVLRRCSRWRTEKID